VFGEVDFLHAFRTLSLSMLDRAEGRKVFGESLLVKVLKIEDLIGFKVQAIANNEARKSMDMADIKSLIAVHKSSINWALIEEYFALFRLDDLFIELRREYGSDQ
jgi:hypothetical protein